MSLRRERGCVSAISLYADWRALPGDAEIEGIWSGSLDVADRMPYQLAVAGVTESPLGRRISIFIPQKVLQLRDAERGVGPRFIAQRNESENAFRQQHDDNDLALRLQRLDLPRHLI